MDRYSSSPRRIDLFPAAKRIELTDRPQDRVSSIMSVSGVWDKGLWLTGHAVKDPSVVIELSMEFWEKPQFCLMNGPISYIAMFQGKKELVEFSVGATPVMPSIDVARDYLLPIVNALASYRPRRMNNKYERISMRQHDA